MPSRRFCRSGGPLSEYKRTRKDRKTLGPRQRTKKKLWKMSVTVIQIITEVLGTAPKNLEKGLEELKIAERIRTIQPKALLRSTGIRRGNLETRGIYCHLEYGRRPTADSGVKNMLGGK